MMEVTMDIRAMCRLCARCDGEGLLELFPSHAPAHSQTPLIETVYNCTGVKISEYDEISTKVCAECREVIQMIHNFKEKCLLSDAFFHHHLNLQMPKQGVCLSAKLSEDGSVKNTSGSKDQNYEISSHGKLEETLPMNGEPEYDFELVKVEIEEDEDSVIESFCCRSDNEVSSSPKCQESARVGVVSPRRKRESPSNSQFHCQLCCRSFGNKSSLSRHKVSHVVKTMKCRYCNKEFKNQESWHRHERMHTKENPYKCHVCGKSYTSSSAHTAHVRKHTGETPFSCTDCHENFYLISSYERHVAKHRGVKEFKCEICSGSFWVKDDLRAHVNRMH